MKIGIVQYAPEWESPLRNMEIIDSMLKNVENEDIIIFPEMTLTGFTMNAGDYAEELDGPVHKYFIRKASELKKEILAGLIEKDNDNIFNSLVHFDSSGLILAKYRKIHPFTYAKENEYYSSGKDVLVSKMGGIPAGLTICYDLRFPELFRLCAKEGAELLVNIANWPTKRIWHWRYLLRARAIENQCFVIGVNRVGTDPYNEYNGCSAVYDPMGIEKLLIEDESGLFSLQIDPNEVYETREKLPFLRDIKLI